MTTLHLYGLQVILVSSQGHVTPTAGGAATPKGAILSANAGNTAGLAGISSGARTTTSIQGTPLPRSTMLPVSTLPSSLVTMATPSYVTNVAMATSGGC